MPESILCATIPFDARFASDNSSHDAYPHRRRRSRHAQAISGAIDEKPVCFKGFMRVSKFLIFAHCEVRPLPTTPAGLFFPRWAITHRHFRRADLGDAVISGLPLPGSAISESMRAWIALICSA